MKFFKYHALGNDYLVLNPKDCPNIFNASQIKNICHRNYGLGSDGILYGPLQSNDADFALKIFNPDGSEAEKSGNGLRIFARYLHDKGLVKNEPFSIMTLGGKVNVQINDPQNSISVDMGKVQFIETQDLRANNNNYTCHITDIGNPHCVIPLNSISKSVAISDGALLEKHPHFPNRTNVQFLKVIDRNTIQIEIWERGAGYTLASGSSSSAAAAVAKKLGLCDSFINVLMPGGSLQIKIEDNYCIQMTGATTRVGDFFLYKELFEQNNPKT